MREPNSNTNVNAVGLKLTTFWTAQLDVWFVQTEAQFRIRGITSDDTKFYYVVGALDQETIKRLIDILCQPPVEQKYEKLKKQLFVTFGLARRARASRFLEMRGLGDRQPSSLLDEMRSLADGQTNNMFFEQLFLRQMPDDIRLQLAQQDFSDWKAVAERADALWDAKNISNNPMGINKINEEKRYHKTVKNIQNDHSSTRCFFHSKFGAKAKKCRKPCSFPSDTTSTSRRWFLVDTGDEISIFPVTQGDRYSGKIGPVLIAANVSQIKTFGHREVKMIFQNLSYCWTFVIAEVPHPIIVADFLRTNGLLVDLKHSRLIDSHSYAEIYCKPFFRTTLSNISGIRTAPKEDLKCSSAELVYGDPLTVPADFIQPSPKDLPPVDLLRTLRKILGSLSPTPTTYHGTSKSHIPKNILSCPFVFIRVDAYRRPLKLPHEGPFRVVMYGPKFFDLDISGRSESISIDRIKSAYTN